MLEGYSQKLETVMKKNLLILALLLLFSIPSIKSLLPFGGYTSHDLTHHVVRQIDMNKLLAEGQFPPRWSGDLNNGYGYPLYIFIYPAPPIMGEVFLRLGYNFVESVKAVMFVSMIISAIGMFLFLESLFPGKRLAAFLGAMFYLYAPIRFLNIYVSAAVGNAVALGFLPFIFWAIVKASQGKKWAIPVGAIFITLLITSHNVTTLMFAPVLAVFSAILIFKSKEKIILMKRLMLMAVLGLGISAFFWIPALAEKKFIVYDQIFGKYWVNQFPAFWQLIRSPWGYGLSHPGVSEPGGMSFQIGLAHLAVILTLVVSTIFMRTKKALRVWGIFCLTTFLSGIFLELKISTFFWENLPLLYLVQFPARFASVAIFAASMGATLLIIYLPYRKIIFVLLLALVLYANRNHLNVNQKFDPGMDYYLSRLETTASENEHLPIWAYAPQKVSPGKLEILDGLGEIKILENKSVQISAEINLSMDSTLRFNQFYFPGWVLKVNGQPVTFSYQENGESRGLPVFKLTKGNYIFETEFADTPDRRAANIISALSLATLGFVLVKNSLRQK